MIKAEMTGDLSAIIVSGAEYGIYVEFGTTRMRARPYLTPALEEVARNIGAEFKSLF